MSEHAGHDMHQGHHCHGEHAHHAAPPAPSTKADLGPGVVYTCPMHPQVRQIGPGSCPICGMALEPETVGGEDLAENAELKSMTLRFWVGLVLALPLLVMEMSGHLFGRPL